MTKINEQARAAFMDYVSGYNMDDIMTSSKVTHTIRVAEFCRRIAASLEMSDSDVALAWMLGLLHDFGRFEQIKRYGTFIDSHSVDHAELGADILFKDGEIGRFIEAGLPAEESCLIETAIRLHNKLNLPEDLPERTKVFSQILRDADKIDIFRVLDEMSFEQRAGKSLGLFIEKDEASPEVMEYVYLHRCIPRALVQSKFEGAISHICLAFELVYDESRRITIEQGYFKKLFAKEAPTGTPLWNEKETRQLEQLHHEIEKYWGTAI
jgi:HD superfamily phosphodiesterase